MEIKLNVPPRTFKPSITKSVEMADTGTVQLDSDEQITFKTSDNKEYDFARKNWGLYVTPSINGRLKSQGFKTALVKNALGKYFINIVESNRLDIYESHCKENDILIVNWLDENANEL